ncbi:spore germination protein [Alkalihalobacterium sp. APHAB7]|uniref:spore germination protein n=1 Tax=Alkalihalobacterium sp. APHAB7 TaxID=3402081 RepID=UPI003AAC9BA2
MTKLQSKEQSPPTSGNDNHNEKSNDKISESNIPPIEHILFEFEDCSDVVHYQFEDIHIDLVYFDHLVDSFELDRDIITPLQHINKEEELSHLWNRSIFRRSHEYKEVIKSILSGSVAVIYGHEMYTVNIFGPQMRSIDKSETEATIIGSHEAFIESIDINLSLIRRRLKSSHLKVIRLEAGEVTKTSISLVYIKDLVNQEFVAELKKRIEAIEFDYITDSNMFVQLIDDYPFSIFPQFLTTERPEVAVTKLSSGKVIGLVDGSPSIFIAPTNFFEFFQSPDDISQRWVIGTATKWLRYAAFFITLTFTSFYVSVTTFHYEMIPETLLLSLGESRNQVPFPPLIEAMVMEFTIELLREAGARLPSKIGQTIGIVGGIVIGQAAVEAGLVSNTLIIAVAISAIASFVMPNYLLSAALRIARFLLIILAGFLGNLGLIIGIAFIVSHLAKVTNINMPYLSPAAPIHFHDWKTAFIRAPFIMLKDRPHDAKSPNTVKSQVKE